MSGDSRSTNAAAWMILLLSFCIGPTACRVGGTVGTVGNECTPRGPMLTQEGTIDIRAHGKGTGAGVWLETDDEEWVLSYGARGSLARLDGERVIVRGRACDPDFAALEGQHLMPTRISVVRRHGSVNEG